MLYIDNSNTEIGMKVVLSAHCRVFTFDSNVEGVGLSYRQVGICWVGRHVEEDRFTATATGRALTSLHVVVREGASSSQTRRIQVRAITNNLQHTKDRMQETQQSYENTGLLHIGKGENVFYT